MLAPSEEGSHSPVLCMCFGRNVCLIYVTFCVRTSDLHELHENRWHQKHMGHKDGEHFHLYEL